MMSVWLCFCISVVAMATTDAHQRNASISFSIDTEKKVFLKDGQPYHYVSGSFHYFRIPAIYWEDRLAKYKAAGLDAVQVYFPWNYHESKPGEFDFSGDKDVSRLLDLIAKHELLAIIRPGPYICAEWDFGGLPAWLLKQNPEMTLRSSDPTYMQFVQRWFNRLFGLFKPHLYSSAGNGPIVMLQIENEYGSYDTCDAAYMKQLVNLARTNLGPDLLLFTTDGNSDSCLKCGQLPREVQGPNTLTTVDFGTCDNVEKEFSVLNGQQPDKPWVNSENYFGWLNHWKEPRSLMSQESIDSLGKLYSHSTRVSVNIYMFHGGTNFGLTNGANAWPYQPQITSYDYGAPLPENGDITQNYLKLREAIFAMKGQTPPQLTVTNVTSIAYPTLELTQTGHILQTLQHDMDFTHSEAIPIEQLDIFDQGLTVYSVKIPQGGRGKQMLSFTHVRDHVEIFSSLADFTMMKWLGSIGPNAVKKKYEVDLDETAEILHAVVENQGRINYGPMSGDWKGVKGQTNLGASVLSNWAINQVDLNATVYGTNRFEVSSGLVYEGAFTIGIGQVHDTNIRPNLKAYGILMLNGQPLGRFDTKQGPQVSLYAPANYWQEGINVVRVILLRMDELSQESLQVTFSRDSIWF